MQRFEKLLACAVGLLVTTALHAEGEPLNIVADTKSISFDSREGAIVLERFANDIMLAWTSLGSTTRENTHLEHD